MIIEKISYNDDRGLFEVLVNNGKIFHISYDCMERFQLKPNLNIDEKILDIIQDEENYYQGRAKALSYISYRQRSRQELKIYLRGKKFTDVVIQKIIDNLEKLKLIDDEAYAMAFVRDKINLNHWGPGRISYELKQRGVKDNIIEKAVNQISQEAYVDLALKNIENKIKRWDKLDSFKKRQKIYNYLTYRGFSYETIQIVFEELDYNV